MSRGRVCVLVDVDGEPASAQFTRKPTEDDLAAFRDVVRAVRARAATLPDCSCSRGERYRLIRDAACPLHGTGATS